MEENILREENMEQMVTAINTSFEESFGRIYAMNAEGRNVATKAAMMHELYKLQDSFYEIVTPNLKDCSLDCQLGCTQCCEFRVSALPAEIFNIVNYLREHKADELEIWEQRLKEHADYVSGLQTHDYQKVCPFANEQGACQIYKVRPFKCRAYHSLDVKICNEKRHSYSIGLLDQLEQMMMQTINDIFGVEQLSFVPCELGQSVHKALTYSELEKEWLLRRNPFWEFAVKDVPQRG